MSANGLRIKNFSKLPYDKSAPITFIIHSAVADDQSTITLLTQDGDGDPGTFAYGLYPLTFDANKQFSMKYGSDATKGLDACQLLVEWDTITLQFPDTITSPQSIGLALNIWWATGVKNIGIQGSADVYASATFNGSTKVIKDANLIYFSVPS
ncbi:hypothetical protein [Trinickia acidisoli]|uniref:hypothetical protein n=1 Tax=Trinickia acidisoli TaxID=2767482 RepID=UPI001A8DA4E0|nr:hypothetical protein [Trinickia acidisoli]